MTKEQIEALLEHVHKWPDEDRAELADYARDIEARRTGFYMLDDDEREAIARARNEGFAPEQDIEAFWGRHGIA